MNKLRLAVLALHSTLVGFQAEAAQYAGSIVAYAPGKLPAAVLSFTNAAAALGEPSRVTPGQYGGPVDPFNPPYLAGQLVSIGAHGSLTVAFDPPIPNDPSHRFGLDFIIFANAGFTITNGNYVGGGITDGTLFGQNTAPTRVSVSADNGTYYVLNPAVAPTVDGGFPTDGSGDFTRPVDPALRPTDFAGQNLDGIRARYAGGAGGNGYDIGWAQDDQDRSVVLSNVRYVRIEVQNGHAEIDGFAVAAGAPGPAAVTFQENFDHDPLGKGWRAFGDASLFQWNATNQNLDITWDSSRSNSYFWLPLDTVLAKDDDFTLQFDLQLNDVAVGTTPGKPFTFEIALGLLNHARATGTNFWRGTGTQSPDLVEFDYFPDSGYGATVWPAFVDTNGIFSFNGSDDYTITALPLGAWLRVNLSYSASNQTMVTKITRDTQAWTDINPVSLSPGFADFRVDAFALSSYSDTGSGGSVLAHGRVDNLAITVPAPPLSSWAGRWTNGGWRVEGVGRSNWVYQLERTADFRAWTGIAAAGVLGDNRVTLTDSNPPSVAAFYRIRADRP